MVLNVQFHLEYGYILQFVHNRNVTRCIILGTFYYISVVSQHHDENIHKS